MSQKMKKIATRTAAWCMVICLLVALLPSGSLFASAAEPETVGAITVAYSEDAVDEGWYQSEVTAEISIVKGEGEEEPLIDIQYNGEPYDVDVEDQGDAYAVTTTFIEEGEYTLLVEYGGDSYEDAFVLDWGEPAIDFSELGGEWMPGLDLWVYIEDGNLDYVDVYVNGELQDVTLEDNSFNLWIDEDGEYEITVECGDKVGNTAAQSEYYYIDCTNPEITFSCEDGEYIAHPELEIDVQDISPVCLEARIDDNWEDMLQFEEYPAVIPLEEGTHTIYVEASDYVGNMVSEEITVTVDTTLPDIWFSAEDGEWLTSSELEIRVTEERLEEIILNVDGAIQDPSVWEDGVAKLNLSAGEHTICVDASDLAGNALTESITVFVNEVDEIAPAIDMSFETNPYDPERQNLVITVTEANLTPENCVVLVNGVQKNLFWDLGSSVEEYVATLALDVDDEYMVEVTVTDNHGNSTTQTLSFLVDTYVPVVEFDFENGQSYVQTQELVITVTEANFNPENSAVTVNGEKYDVVWNGDMGVYTANVAFADDGEYTVEATAEDLAGNIVTERVTFIVDTFNPEVNLSVFNGACISAGEGYELVISVTEQNFVAENTWVLVNGEEQTVAWNQDENGVYQAAIVLSDGAYTVEACSTDAADRTSPIETVSFVVDSAVPVVSVAYSENHTGWWENMLETISFGFYQSPVTVTLRAVDYISGVEEITYKVVAEGADEAEVAAVTVAAMGGMEAEYSFEIDPEFRGYIIVTATDKAGNETVLNDSATTIVVDNIVPGVEVSYEGHEADADWYSSSVTATITIDEANFFGEKEFEDGMLSVQVGERHGNSGDYTVTEQTPTFEYDAQTGKYTAVIDFINDGSYTLNIAYTDRSGNEAEPYAGEFVIDTTAPVIELSHPRTHAYYDDAVYLEISVVEVNFDPALVDGLVEWVGIDGRIHYESISDLLSEVEWAHDGDVHTAGIWLETEGDYSVAVDCSDAAGNAAERRNAEFTIDLTDPVIELSRNGDDICTEDQILSITVTEHNFDAANISGIIMAADDNGNTHDLSDKLQGLEWMQTGDAYSAELALEMEGDYTISLGWTDPAGREAEAPADAFTLDKTAPVVKLSRNGGVNCTEDQLLVITVTEHNFDASGILGVIKVVDNAGEKHDLSDKLTGLEWSQNGNTYTAQVRLDMEGDYTIAVFCKDAAGQPAMVAEDAFTLDKTAPVVKLSHSNDGMYYAKGQTLKITVTEHNFDAAKAPVIVNDVKQEDIHWNSDGDVHTAAIPMEADGRYVVEVGCVDTVGNSGVTAHASFTVDQTKPTGLSITYGEDANWWQSFLETITFGFYQAPATVTLSAQDTVGGIDRIEYKVVEEGADEAEVAAEVVEYDGAASAECPITIGEEFRGYITFTVYDMSGNYETISDKEITTIVVDTIAPGVDVTYEGVGAGEGYYNSRVTATICIDEANFFGEKDFADGMLSVQVGERHGNYGDYTVTEQKPAFEYDAQTGKYTADIAFVNDGNYTLNIAYTDRSGNEAEPYEGEFVIDTTAPVIELSHPRAHAYYDDAVYLEISVVEANFDEGLIAGLINWVDDEEQHGYHYVDLLLQDAEWTHEGDVHTVGIWLEDAGDYNVTVEYVDFVGQEAELQEANFTVDLTNPVIELSRNGGDICTEDQTLVITVTEHNFDAANISGIIMAADDNGNTHDLSDKLQGLEWKRSGNTYTAEITLDMEGDYAITVNGSDLADRQAAIAVDMFTLDKTAPVVELSRNGDDICAEDQTLVITVTEHNFDAANFSGTIEVVDDAGEKHDLSDKLQGLEWSQNDNTYTAQVLLDMEGDYTITASSKDAAGQPAMVAEDAFTLDKTAPEVGLVRNGGGICTVDQKLVITVTEHNFDVTGLIGSITVEDDEGATHDLSDKLQGLEWTQKGNVYTAEFRLDAEGDYTISVSWADPAGQQAEAATDSFTLDKTAPVVELSHGNDGVYYDADQTLTITVTEHNFNASGILGAIKVVDDEGVEHLLNDKLQGLEWSQNGNTYTAQVLLDVEGDYTIAMFCDDTAGKYSAAAEAAFTLDKTAPVIELSHSNDGVYYDADQKLEITITEHNFNAANTVVTINGTERQDVSWTSNGNVRTAYVDLADECYYAVEVRAADEAGNPGTAAHASFTVDKSKPVGLNIAYGEGGNWWEALLELVTFGFYKAPATVTLSAQDTVGGIDRLVYKVVEEGINEAEVEAVVVEYDHADHVEYPITIGEQFRGYVTFTAYDMSGNYETISDKGSTTIVVDTIAPGIAVSYDDVEVDKGYYNSEVTATIRVNEANFFNTKEIEDGMMTVSVGVRGDNETEYTVTEQTCTFEYDDVNGDYVTTLKFVEDADYTLTIQYTDRAGNAAETYEGAFTIDTTVPVIELSHEADGTHYDAGQTLVIEIEEHNFVPDYVTGTLVYVDDSGVETVSDLSVLLAGKEWTQTDNIHTMEIELAEAGDYRVAVDCKDPSGLIAKTVEASLTVDLADPVIDVVFDENDVRNEEYFNVDRTATITITEHNFVPALVKVEVGVYNAETDAYEIDEGYALTDEARWTAVEGKLNTYQATIVFEGDNHYTFAISCEDPSGRGDQGVNFGDSKAPERFTVDETAPTELSIMIGDASVVDSDEGEEGEEGISIVFDTFYPDAVSVILDANCDISGLESLEYQKVDVATDYKADGQWLPYDAETGIAVAPNDRFVIFFRATDMAGNTTIIHSTGIVVDDQRPIGETNAPDIDIIAVTQPNEDGLYNGDVTLDLKVVDPAYLGGVADGQGYYSGLNKIIYRIYAPDTAAEETGVLLDVSGAELTGAVVDDDGLISSWSGQITIRSEVFNSNNIFVEVVAVDNAGNTRITPDPEVADSALGYQYMIDVTAPEIAVSYSNNAADSESYFNADRIATIVITERNFDPEDVIITLTNTDGVIPELVGWEKAEGTGNGDNTTWTATLAYTADGDYEFDIQYTDMAENACAGANYGDSVAPTAFTVDKTLPTVSVSYNNNSAANGNYYKDARTATIVVTEHNFDPARVVIAMTATDDGAAVSVPAVSGWSTNGDHHTATIAFANDALYSFDIDVKDMAGNDAADYAQDSFYVDRTMPSLTITGVEDQSANNGDVIPVVTGSDTNYDQATITLVGANRGEVELEGAYSNIHNGKVFTFENFAELKEVDDIYTLTATLTDKAGNVTVQTILFSVNRFGSTYALDEAAAALNGSYVQTAPDVVITETNANALTNIKITLFKNNETLVLTEGADYKLEVTGGEGQWYCYTYTVYAENFADDGVYRLTLHSEDSAGNVAENTLDTKQTTLSFGVDKTQPNVIVTNLEGNTTYALENMTVEMSISDNLQLAEIVVYLDDYSTPYATWSGEEIDAVIAENGAFTFDVAGDSTGEHKVKVVCTDAAGNEQTEEIEGFYVTTNLWVRYFNNKPLFYGSIAAVIILVLLLAFLASRRKKSEVKQ